MADKPSAIRGARIVGERYARAKRQENPEGRMPLFDHLRELRNRVVKIALAVLVGRGRVLGVLRPDLGLHAAALLPGRRVLQERTCPGTRSFSTA